MDGISDAEKIKLLHKSSNLQISRVLKIKIIPILISLLRRNLKFMEHEDQVRGGLLGIITRYEEDQVKTDLSLVVTLLSLVMVKSGNVNVKSGNCIKSG